ncbi:AAA family ATPase [Streptomyces sp. SID8379]|uniref:KGGVGR-motif variant AAA ATPase n=1 Tax=unclassified Streptomyces TaxID=2593676 RepID=UPI00036A87B7|nr:MULTISPECIES: AAA family ATPase [unclassified Streptomyces]MYW64885.1 AAA family ATPase [Streptomyces sp. SID8379]
MTYHDVPVRFDEARPAAFTLAREVAAEGFDVLLVRDVLGRFSLLVDDAAREAASSEQADNWMDLTDARLGRYRGERPLVLTSVTRLPRTLTAAPHAMDVEAATATMGSVRFLDNTVVGEDWSRVSAPSSDDGNGTRRTALYGFKGGVGRTTAASVLARALADEGKIVLVVDLDLESPGVGPLLLGSGTLCQHGVVDHLVESALGNAEGLEIVARSGYSPSRQGELWIAPARGAGTEGVPNGYVDKLNRVYADAEGARFADRLAATVRACEEAVERSDSGRRPDVVLLDSRAGIHDVAAVTISHLCDYALLFGADNAQTWAGYGDLFEAWAASGQAAAIRQKLRMVASMVPDSAHYSQDVHLKSFRAEAFKTFSVLYESLAPGEISGAANEAWVLEDDAAPHSPIPILFEPGLVGMNVPDSPDWQERAFVQAAYRDFLGTAIPLIMADPATGAPAESEEVSP